MDKSYLEETRQNALDSLNNLLRVSEEKVKLSIRRSSPDHDIQEWTRSDLYAIRSGQDVSDVISTRLPWDVTILVHHERT
jgi:hypothetical protein